MNLDLAVGEPITWGSLTLFPLRSDARPAPSYLTGPEAEAAAVLDVAEHDVATVPELVVVNCGDWPVLLIEGEQLVGAKQNRTLNVSVLCTAGASTTIPVSCVEAGRWGAPQAATRSHRHAPSDLRRLKTKSVLECRRAGDGVRSDQAAVWDRVNTYAAEHAVVAPTSALEDVFGAVDNELDELLADVRPAPDQRGVIVATEGRVRSLDLFDKSSTLVAYWDGLVAGYAMDALRAEAAEPSPVDADAFVAKILASTASQHPGVGIGTDYVLEDDGLVGTALEWEGGIVHLAAFATSHEPTVPKTHSRPIRRRFRSR